jgi:hypothetical protein
MLSLWHLGYAEQAVQVNRSMHDLAVALGHPFSLAFDRGLTSWLNIHCGSVGEVETASDELLGGWAHLKQSIVTP